jgi:hypothetical protein
MGYDCCSLVDTCQRYKRTCRLRNQDTLNKETENSSEALLNISHTTVRHRTGVIFIITTVKTLNKYHRQETFYKLKHI